MLNCLISAKISELISSFQFRGGDEGSGPFKGERKALVLVSKTIKVGSLAFQKRSQ